MEIIVIQPNNSCPRKVVTYVFRNYLRFLNIFLFCVLIICCIIYTQNNNNCLQRDVLVTPFERVKSITYSFPNFQTYPIGVSSEHFLYLSNIRNMKYVQFKYKCDPTEIRVGYMEGDDVVDINKHDSETPSTMLGILLSGCSCKVMAVQRSQPIVEPIDSVTLMAPITGMDKILCVCLNYADQCQAQNIKIPEVPAVFSKFASTVIGQNETVKLRSKVVKKLDWEVEMTLVIGAKCSNVSPEEAFKYVFGYTVAQDISSRDWQKEANGGQFLLGKSQDTFCPLGPWIVTSDEIEDPQNLDIRCSVNGVLKQESNTSNMIHKIPDIIARLSSVMTLLPGDIILTGSPGGSGNNRTPPEFLKPGDVILSEIENIGSFEVTVEEASDDPSVGHVVNFTPEQIPKDYSLPGFNN